MKTKLSILFIFLAFLTCHAQINNSFDVVLGIDRTYRNLNTTENSELATLLKNSAEGETAKFNWRLGANYRKGLSEKTYLKIGARLSNVGYKSELIGLVFGSDLDIEDGLDPKDSSDVRFATNYLFIELPLSFGVIKQKDKFSFFAEAGLSPNFYLTTRTKQVLDGEDSSTDSQRNPAVRTAHLSALLAVGAAYLINDNISIFGQPSFRYHITTLGRDIVLKEFLFGYGIEFGLRWNL